MRRFEEIGIQIMNRASNGDVAHNAIASVLADRDKRRMVAQILGQAYIKAHHLILHNKEKVDDIAKVVIQKKELYGDELVKLLNGANLRSPTSTSPTRRRGPKLGTSRVDSPHAYLALAALLGVAIERCSSYRASRAEAASSLVGVAAERGGRVPRGSSRSRPRRSQYQLNGGKRLVRVVVRDPGRTPT